MSDPAPFIPQASEPDTYVNGRLVPDEYARDVRRGWKSGVFYLALQLLATALVLGNSSALNGTDLLLTALELGVLAACVWGVRQWSLTAAVILFCAPILGTLALAAQPPAPIPSQGAGGVRVFLLVVFLYFFARAALAIWRFNRSVKSAA